MENSNVSQRLAGNADEFHNACVELAKIGFYDYAFSLLLVGHARYQSNTDIIADLLSYGMKCRTLDELKEYYSELKAIKDKRLWTWRAYQFAFDYLMECYKSNLNEKNNQNLEKEIENIISDFQNESIYFEDQSDREKSFIVEYEYYYFKRELEKAFAALERATKVLPNKCAQCALKYADYLFAKD